MPYPVAAARGKSFGKPSRGTSKFLLPTWTNGVGDTLYFYESLDGISFTHLVGSYTKNGVIVRDGWVYDDGSTYWVVYGITNGGNAVSALGLAKSTDLATWTYVTNIDLSGAQVGVQMVYAGKWFVTDDGNPHVVVPVSSNLPGTLFALYETHPTNGIMTTWSAPVALTGTLPASCYDPFIVKKAGTYYLWLVNYDDSGTVANSYIEIYSSSSPFSGYSAFQTGNWAGWGGDNEAVTVRLIGSTWRMYADQSVGAGSPALRYSESTDNWSTWSALKYFPIQIGKGRSGDICPTDFVMPAATLSDVFTGTNGTALSTYNAAYSELVGTFDIQSNKARSVSVVASIGVALRESGVADNCMVALDVTADFTSNHTMGMIFRGIDENNLLFAAITSGALSIYKRVTSTFTQLGTVAHVFASNTAYTITVILNGTDIQAVADGVRVTVASSQFQSSTKVGLYAGLAGDLFDNLKVTNG